MPLCQEESKCQLKIYGCLGSVMGVVMSVLCEFPVASAENIVSVGQPLLDSVLARGS